MKILKLDGYTGIHGEPGFSGNSGFFIQTTKDFIFACKLLML
jgi:hypothetical protein